jgi:hypothetical protein
MTALELANAWMISRRYCYGEPFVPPKNACELAAVAKDLVKNYGNDWEYRIDELKGDWEKDRDSLLPTITAWMF